MGYYVNDAQLCRLFALCALINDAQDKKLAHLRALDAQHRKLAHLRALDAQMKRLAIIDDIDASMNRISSQISSIQQNLTNLQAEYGNKTQNI